MKQLIAIILLLSVFLGAPTLALVVPGETICEAAETGQINLPIKHLRSAPVIDAKVIYDIPVTVELLEVSGDGNWHKVKIAYAVGPFSYTYVGWAYIPVGKVLAERQAQTPAIASLIKDK